MATDLYDTLSPADQQTFRATLFAVMNPMACPTTDLSTITGPESLIDVGNRALAVNCAQAALGVGTAAGVVDEATYNAIMHPAVPLTQSMPWSTQKKVAVGAAAVGGAALLWWLLKRKRR